MSYSVVPFSKNRRLVTDLGRLSSGKPTIRGLLEIDVTLPRKIINDYKEKTGKSLSFTAYLASCLGQAVSANKRIHAYQNWRGQLVIFEDVDITIMIEVEEAGKNFPIGHIVRSANNKTVHQIQAEIREVQAKPKEAKNTRSLSYVSLLPGIIRRCLLKWIDLSPHRFKRYKGTVILTSIGMFGQGGGWGLSLPSHTLGVTIGGISRKPGIIDDRIEPREYLHVTLDFNHDVVDGAPAARFAEHFRELVESGTGL
jgi:pyruvate/2-oxoglutarate dehydrogenase complex dihydrolipoamide acyltransferase (E2) component